MQNRQVPTVRKAHGTTRVDPLCVTAVYMTVCGKCRNIAVIFSEDGLERGISIFPLALVGR